MIQFLKVYVYILAQAKGKYRKIKLPEERNGRLMLIYILLSYLNSFLNFKMNNFNIWKSTETVADTCLPIT